MAASSQDSIEGLAEGASKHYAMVVLTNKKLLFDEQFSDLTISVGNDKVQAHSAIVACRCEEIVKMPVEADKKKKPVKAKKDAKIKGITNEQIMRRVLEFLYTGMVEFPKLQTLEILQLNSAARLFKLNRLGYLCERWLREHMDTTNVFILLKGAVDAGESRVKAFCLQFALDNYNHFIANKDGIHILGIDLFQEVVKAFTERPPPPEEIPPDKAPPDTLIEDFKRLYEKMPFSDVVFNVSGTQIKCHKAILAAHSEAFIPIVANAPATGVDFNQLSAEAFRSMLKYLYYGDDNIDSRPATELVGFSKQFKLNSLLRICEDKCRTSVSCETVLDILATTYIPEMEEKPELVKELKSKTFPFILANLTDIDLLPIRNMHRNIAVDILLQIQQTWGEAPPPIPADVSPRAAPSGGFALGSQRAAAPPPPARGGDEDRPPPPPPRSGAAAQPAAGASASEDSDDDRPPPPPPRDGGGGILPPPSLSSGGPLPPPRLGDQAPPASSGGSVAAPPAGKPAKKPDDKKKKDDDKKEKKRIEKEKKEREKMEKKLKGGKSTGNVKA